MHLNLVRTLLCAGAVGLSALAAGCGSEDDATTAAARKERETSPRVEAVVADYRGYLQENAEELVATTRPFVAAVVAGNLAEAKELYAVPRIPYERIEPVADSFGALDRRSTPARTTSPPATSKASTGSRRRSGRKARPPA